MPDLSIIIINYNTFELTSACLLSILKIQHSASYEILLIDNGSIELKSQYFKSAFPDIVFIKSLENLGFSKAVNKCLEIASGNVILLLNSDTIVQENTIAIVKEADAKGADRHALGRG
ncbi:MAG TPA: glycosyltransferase, partial [Chitinophagales bacterium]|nr:glycosyltransferase [Chitinophagales bacterium]